MTEHFIPFRKRDLIALAARTIPGIAPVAGLIDRLLAREFADRLDRLKDLYHPLDPNRDTGTCGDGVAAADPAGFSTALQELLTRANYRVLSAEELQQAFTSESVFQVKLHTELADFRELTIYVRGRRRRQETIRRWFGLRSRTIDVEYFERVLINIRFQEAAHFPEKRRRSLPFTPGTTQLKLFANVPAADIEMLFPNSEVRMKTGDKLMIGIPAALGIATMSAKIIVVLGFLWAGLRWVGAKAGVHQDSVDVGTLAAEAGLVLGACVAIYLFIGRQLMRYRFRKLQFIKALSDNLYFRNLDNNAGAFHRVLDEALEEDAKEAVLAYAFLVAAPGATAAELDRRIEDWIRDRLQTTVDFEVDDGLAKLERLGLATREGERWTALSPTDASRTLRSAWGALAD